MMKFRIKKIDIEIDFMFVAIVCIFLLLDKTGVSTIALLSCLIHEMAHMIMFLLVGYTPSKLSFELTGIRLTKPVQMLTRGKEMLVLVAGSGLNLIIFFLLIKTINTISFLSLFAVTNLVLGIFNLLPIKSFDGGKISEIIISYFTDNITACKICNVLNIITILMLLGVGIFIFIISKSSISLLVIMVCIIISSLIRLIHTNQKIKKST